MLSATALVVICDALFAQVPAQSDEDFFESKVRPLLAEKCFDCHSNASAKVKGGLKLDSRAALLAGGTSGEVVVPGDVDASALIEAVRYEGLVQMPPKGKLDLNAIAALEEWVRRGAYFSDSTEDTLRATEPTPREMPPLWSFAPLSRPNVPAVRDESWCRTPLDSFVLANLEANGLAPAAEADRRTLLRRLSYDLIGLPPTETDYIDFERDTSPDAWERRIDQMLASPHYGERWGRAWLDLARYADSNGLDENLAMSNAWRYRDWVVRALNADLPYDEFLTYQLAGDLLPPTDDDSLWRDRLIATGFLVLGPKMLAEQDKEKLIFDVVDEQLDVAFRTFQGLTVGCARCHDHKFDPISQRDYYALAGIFKSTATMGNVEFVSRWNERELERDEAVNARREHVKSIEAARVSLNDARAAAEVNASRQRSERLGSYLLAGQDAARRAIVVEAEQASRGNLIEDDSMYGSADVTVARTGKSGQQFAEYDLTFARSGRVEFEVRWAAIESRPMRLSHDGVVIADAVLGETTGSWNPDGQRWFTVATLDVRSGRNVVRLERDGAIPHIDKLLFTPIADGADASGWPLEGNPWVADLAAPFVRGWACEIIAAERRAESPFALWSRCAQLPSDEFEARAALLFEDLRRERDAEELPWNPHVLRLLDDLPPTSLRELAGRYAVLLSSADLAWSQHVKKDPAATGLGDPALEELRRIVSGPASPFRLGANDLEELYSAEHRELVRSRRAELESLEADLLPEFDRALCVRESAEIGDSQLLRRGSHLDKTGEPIPRGTLSALAKCVPFPPIGASASGRLQLARWMTSPDHPLTARVAVNRLWQGHFGRGLVASSSNFGHRGDTPSHPELLDWLALELRDRGWSLKALHKLICSSSAYRMSSDASALTLERDAENRLISRQNRRRLEAELVRDTVLALTGRLDTTVGGSLLATENGAYVTNDQSANGVRYDEPRRALYLPIIRNAMLDLYSAFDYPDASVTVEARSQTTSPNQALYLMNSPLVIESSRRVIDELASTSDTDRRIDALHRRLLGRAASPSELDRARRFVAAPRPAPQPPTGADVGREHGETADETSDAAQSRWRSLAQVLLISNEVLFVD